MIKSEFIISAHNTGSHSKTGSGYGFRIRHSDIKKILNMPRQILLYLEKSEHGIKVNASDAFSDYDRITITSKEIGEWLLENKIAPWKKGEPPKFCMTHIKDNEFRINRI